MSAGRRQSPRRTIASMSSDAEFLDDLWWSRDFPILRETVRVIDAKGPGKNYCSKIAEAAGITEEEADAAFLALERSGLVRIFKAGGRKPVFVNDVAGEAYGLVGAYPNPDATVQRLVAALEAQLETAPPEKKRAIQKVLEGFRQIGENILVKVVSDVVTGRIPG